MNRFSCDCLKSTDTYQIHSPWNLIFPWVSRHTRHCVYPYSLCRIPLDTFANESGVNDRQKRTFIRELFLFLFLDLLVYIFPFISCVYERNIVPPSPPDVCAYANPNYTVGTASCQHNPNNIFTILRRQALCVISTERFGLRPCAA